MQGWRKVSYFWNQVPIEEVLTLGKKLLFCWKVPGPTVLPEPFSVTAPRLLFGKDTCINWKLRHGWPGLAVAGLNFSRNLALTFLHNPVQ